MTNPSVAVEAAPVTTPAQHDTNPQLSIRRLTVSYAGGGLALRGVDLDVAAGEIIGVIGESGSGKSSLALAAMGLLPASASVTADRLLVSGVDFLNGTEDELRSARGSHVGMVFQEPTTSLNPTMRIGTHLDVALRNHRRLSRAGRRAAASELLELVRIVDPQRIAGQFPHQLSGGQQQRVAIAMAMAGKPPLLIADEPTTALDVTTQAEILALFRWIRDETGVAILFISHDLGVISSIANQTAVILHGQIVDFGPTHQVLSESRHPYTRALLDALPGSVPPRQPLRTIDTSDLHPQELT